MCESKLDVQFVEEFMAHFVAVLRRNGGVLLSRSEIHHSRLKSELAASSDVDELGTYIHDSAADSNLMVRLPSMEVCLQDWWGDRTFNALNLTNVVGGITMLQ